MRRIALLTVAFLSLAWANQATCLAGSRHSNCYAESCKSNCYSNTCHSKCCKHDWVEILGFSSFRDCSCPKVRNCPQYIYPNRAPRDFWMLR